MKNFDTEGNFGTSFDDELRIIPFGFWIIIALLFGIPGWYFIIRIAKHAWL